MRIFDFYSDNSKKTELLEILTLGAQQHPAGLAANFLEKDIWVTEILRLLYSEILTDDLAVAFKGGTALSKCWKMIDRFSEDIDLSIHWADLAREPNEHLAWEKSTQSRSQRDKFRKRQTSLLTDWSIQFVKTLNTHLNAYNISNLTATLDENSKGEKINIHYPSVTANKNHYQLDHILLEFGGRNRGRPTQPIDINCYLSEVNALHTLSFPTATVQAYEPGYILWGKLTALHQFSTQTKEPNPRRLARHWYDVDCLLEKNFADPLNEQQAMKDVVEMKTQRWAEKGVDFFAAASGGLLLIPNKERLVTIAKDHQDAINGGMFFTQPDTFEVIAERLKMAQGKINLALN